MEFSPNDIQKLAQLLRPPEPEVLQGEDYTSKGFVIERVDAQNNQEREKEIKTVEEYEEKLAEELDQGSCIDNRKEPKYFINYKQAVTPEDIFLQMGFKTPASASCENLVVKIEMPGDKKENVDLTVNKDIVYVYSPRYALKMPLPHPVNPDASSANWDSSTSTLILTLKLDREFDDLNM